MSSFLCCSLRPASQSARSWRTVAADARLLFSLSTFGENFDHVTPPALPPAWLATNALGPPPLWVTSNSGVPMPPADTAPNALFIDDPPVVSEKRLDGWFLDFFEDCCVQLTFRHNFNL